MGLPNWVTHPAEVIQNNINDWTAPGNERTPNWLDLSRGAPGSAQSLGSAVAQNEWSHPYGADANSMDIYTGGFSSTSPVARRIGRGVGTAFGLGAVAGLAGGSEAGASATYDPAVDSSAAATSAGPEANPSLSGFSGGGGEGIGMPGETTTSGETVPGSPGGSMFGSGVSNFFNGLSAPSLGQVGAGLNIGSGVYGLYLAQQAQAERKRKLQQQREYQQRLNDLMANPGSVTSLPGYQFRMDQGAQAIQRRMAALGYNRSGNQATALTRYGQDYATGELERQEGLLAKLYGMSGPDTSPVDPFNMASRSLASLGYGVGRM